MQKDKLQIIRKEIENSCYICNGTGKIINRIYPKLGIREFTLCPSCRGTGKHIETFYYHVVNGICVSGDTLK